MGNGEMDGASVSEGGRNDGAADAPGPDWAAIRRAYEGTDLSLRALGQRFGVSPHAIGQHARWRGWVVNAARRRAARRMERVREAGWGSRALESRAARRERGTTVERLRSLVERLTVELERRLDGTADEASGLDAREGTAQMLNALTRAVAGLEALERRPPPGRAFEERAGNNRGAEDGSGGELGADAAWAEVERRLARLAAESGAEPGP